MWSFLATLILIRVGFVHDVPNNRSSHVHATPTLGGISFAAPMFLAMAWTQPIWVCASLLLILIVGGIDDIRGLSYRMRLMVQCIAGIVVMLNIPCWISALPIPAPALWAMTLFLLVGVMNGANFIDGLNGLLSGCVMTAMIIWWIATPAWSTIWLVSFVSVLAFWILNRQGNIFMGDLGSTFLGLWVGITGLALQSQHPESAVGGLCTQGLIITLAPLMFVWGDVSFTLCHRWWRGEVLSQAHRDHFIHRLADVGYGHTRITLLYMAGTLYMGGMTLAYVWGHIHLGAFVASYLVPQVMLARRTFVKQG